VCHEARRSKLKGKLFSHSPEIGRCLHCTSHVLLRASKSFHEVVKERYGHWSRLSLAPCALQFHREYPSSGRNTRSCSAQATFQEQRSGRKVKQPTIRNCVSLNFLSVSLTFSPGMRIGSSLASRVSSQNLSKISPSVIYDESF
jgi:hypothetical protein